MFCFRTILFRIRPEEDAAKLPGNVALLASASRKKGRKTGRHAGLSMPVFPGAVEFRGAAKVLFAFEDADRIT